MESRHWPLSLSQPQHKIFVILLRFFANKLTQNIPFRNLCVITLHRDYFLRKGATTIMSYIDNFSHSAGTNYFTPQRIMNAVIRECAEGSSVKGNADLHAAQHLQNIVDGMNGHLNGRVPNSPLEGEGIVRQMAVVEIESIKAVIDTACPVAQTKALRDIIQHGSLSSARLNRSKFPEGKPAEAVPVFEGI